MPWTPRKKRISGSEITYKGKTYPSIVALYREWEGDKPSERTLSAKLLTWKKKHPTEEITDKVIEKLFETRSGKNGLQFQGKEYAGARELYDSYDGEKISYGGFWLKVKQYQNAHQSRLIPDEIIRQFFKTHQGYEYKGVIYPSLSKLYDSLNFKKISKNRFIGNLNSWSKENPKSLITDSAIESCAKFYGGDYEYKYKGKLHPTLESLYDSETGPKCKLVTFRLRFKKLKAQKRVTEEDINNLLKETTKVAFFKGILYRWTHKSSGKVYIGISSMPLKERIRMHARQAKDGSYKNPNSLQAAIAKDGLDAFRIEVIDEFDDEKDMLIAEDRAIKTHDSLSPRGFNLRDGGLGWTKQGKDVEYDGITYPSYAALAKKFGISEKLLDGRRRWGWELQEALTTPPHTRNKSATQVVVKNESFTSLRKAAERYKIPYQKVYERITRGWTIEEALDITKKDNPTRKSITVDGVTFPTISAAAKHYKIDPKKVYQKIGSGKSIEQALEIDK